jgi:outer membrane protein OmpA-like peptidoglycan-associated protein
MLRNYRFLASSAILFLSASAFAQSPGNVDDMVNQLLPAAAKAGSPASADSVLTVQTATKDEIISRLDLSGSRSLGAQGRSVTLSLLTPGHEAEALTALKPLPSMQVAVAFQGASDALAPEAGALIGALSQALADPKLASSRFLIGVHTNSIGSDEYNLSLSSLRAKAIVGALTAVHGVARDRLIPLGFGRITEAVTQGSVPDERIRVVNLGPNVPDNRFVAPPVPVPLAAKPAGQKPAKVVARKTKVKVVHAHPRPGAGRIAVVPRRHVARLRADSGDDAAPRIRRHRRPASWSAGWAPVTSTIRPQPSEGYQMRFGSDAWSGGQTQVLGGGSMPVDRGSRAGGGGNGGSGGGGGGGGAGGAGGGGAGGGGAGGGGWSDRRLKRFITRVGQTPRGYALYSFQYIWGGPFYVGVMAQDLITQCPEAIIQGPGGYLKVDYDKLDIQMMTLEAWQAASVHAGA